MSRVCRFLQVVTPIMHQCDVTQEMLTIGFITALAPPNLHF